MIRGDNDSAEAATLHCSQTASVPSVPTTNTTDYGTSLPDRHRQMLFHQQKQRALAARRLRTSSWSHRLSQTYSVTSDDGSGTVILPSRGRISASNDNLAYSRRYMSLSEVSEPGADDAGATAPKRTFWQLFRNNMFQLGLELLYATETALVTPILLKLGLPESLYSITWLFSPILGFIFTPLIGSLSDRCRLRWGRRRPFVLAFAIGMILGVTMLLNGGDLGLLLGDSEDSRVIGLIITLVGMFLMDFSANSGDCPARAYLIDVCSINQLEFALSLRTLLGGVGGGLGYILNGVEWETTHLSVIGDQERIIFIMVGFLASVSFLLNLFSITEVPLARPETKDDERTPLLADSRHQKVQPINSPVSSVIAEEDVLSQLEEEDDEGAEPGSIKELLKSIIYMPRELAHLCFNHFLGWLSYLIVLLFFTDYVAQAVYKGDPTAPEGSEARALYDEGVEVGCWGLCIFSFSCAITAGIYSKQSHITSHRTVYVFGQLFFAVCTGSMALLTWSPIGTMVLCSSFGVMFFILLTIPSCLIGVYHESEQYVAGKNGYRRGIGKDIACIGVQIFIAQIIDSTIVGPLVNFFDTHLVIVLLSSLIAFLAAIYSSIFVVYEIRPEPGVTEDQKI